MINIAIVDDDIRSVDRIREYLDRYSVDMARSFNITAFSDGDMIVSGYNHQFDVIFMDVEMKFMDGMSAAEEIRKIDSEVVIIFITNMAQYAIRGYAVQALDYLLKPVSYFAFAQCLNKALSRRDSRGTRSVGHTTICHVVNGEYRLLSTMREVEDQLFDLHFFRISKSYLINLAHAENFQGDEVKLGKYSLPVSRMRKKEFLKALTSYWEEVISCCSKLPFRIFRDYIPQLQSCSPALPS